MNSSDYLLHVYHPLPIFYLHLPLIFQLSHFLISLQILNFKQKLGLRKVAVRLFCNFSFRFIYY